MKYLLTNLQVITIALLDEFHWIIQLRNSSSGSKLRFRLQPVHKEPILELYATFLGGRLLIRFHSHMAAVHVCDTVILKNLRSCPDLKMI